MANSNKPRTPRPTSDRAAMRHLDHAQTYDLHVFLRDLIRNSLDNEATSKVAPTASEQAHLFVDWRSLETTSRECNLKAAEEDARCPR